MKFGLQFECNCLLGHLLLAIVVVVDYFQNCSPHLSIIHTFKTIHLLDYMILLSFFAIVTTIAILYYLLDVSLINAYNLLQVCNSCINQKSHLTSMQYNYTACSNIKSFYVYSHNFMPYYYRCRSWKGHLVGMHTHNTLVILLLLQ